MLCKKEKPSYRVLNRLKRYIDFIKSSNFGIASAVLFAFACHAVEAMTELESLLEARGMIRGKHISTILQCVIFILGVNHVLACVTVYVARREQTQQRINWLDENQVSDNSIFFQYMHLGLETHKKASPK